MFGWLKRKGLIILLSFVTGILAASAYVYASENIRIVVNGVEIESDVSPEIINGRVMVPIRWVSEALNANVHWDKNSRQVNVSTSSTQRDTSQLTFEEQLNQIKVPDAGLQLDTASEDEIVAFIQQVESWRSDVFSIPIIQNKWTITEQQKELMYSHLGQMLSENIIDDYFNRHYAKDGNDYRALEIDVAIIPSDWDEYIVEIVPLEDSQFNMDIKAILQQYGMINTHESLIHSIDGKLFFKSFSTTPN